MAALPAFVTPVGLFADASLETVREITTQLRLRHIQLYGDESFELTASLRDLCIIRGIHVVRENFSEQLKSLRQAISRMQLQNLKGLLLETASGNRAGGTGVANDWQTIRANQEAGEFDGLPPLIAAGGLRPETVGEVVRQLRPFAVDVSSGIESVTGIKSPQKMGAFVDAVDAADAA